jgi:hypothetical protein
MMQRSNLQEGGHGNPDGFEPGRQSPTLHAFQTDNIGRATDYLITCMREQSGWEDFLAVAESTRELGWLDGLALAYRDAIKSDYDARRAQRVWDQFLPGLRMLLILLNKGVSERWSLALYVLRNQVQVIDFVQTYGDIDPDYFESEWSDALTRPGHRNAWLCKALQMAVSNDFYSAHDCYSALERVSRFVDLHVPRTRQGAEKKQFAMMLAEHAVHYTHLRQDLSKLLVGHAQVSVVRYNMSQSLVHSNYNELELKEVHDVLERMASDIDDCASRMVASGEILESDAVLWKDQARGQWCV